MCDNHTVSKYPGEIGDFKMHIRRQMNLESLCIVLFSASVLRLRSSLFAFKFCEHGRFRQLSLLICNIMCICVGGSSSSLAANTLKLAPVKLAPPAAPIVSKVSIVDEIVCLRSSVCSV